MCNAGVRAPKARWNTDCAPQARRNIGPWPKASGFYSNCIQNKKNVASKASPLHVPSQHTSKPSAWHHNSCSPGPRQHNGGHSPQQGISLEPNEHSMASSFSLPACAHRKPGGTHTARRRRGEIFIRGPRPSAFIQNELKNESKS